MPGARAHLKIGWAHFWRQVFKVLRNPIFFALTLLGNSTWLLASALFYYYEVGVNPAVTSWFDGIYWAILTMTTVGYGDIVPVTTAGRVIAMGLILSGGVMFLSFIALLSSAFTELEFIELGKEVKAVSQRLRGLEDKLKTDS